MPLATEFRKYLEGTIHGIITGIPTLKKEYPKFKEDWGFENEFDFLFGSIVGQMLGTGLMAFKMTYDRDASADEILEIGEMVESYLPAIRGKIRSQ